MRLLLALCLALSHGLLAKASVVVLQNCFETCEMNPACDYESHTAWPKELPLYVRAVLDSEAQETRIYVAAPTASFAADAIYSSVFTTNDSVQFFTNCTASSVQPLNTSIKNKLTFIRPFANNQVDSLSSCLVRVPLLFDSATPGWQFKLRNLQGDAIWCGRVRPAFQG